MAEDAQDLDAIEADLDRQDQEDDDDARALASLAEAEALGDAEEDAAEPVSPPGPNSIPFDVLKPEHLALLSDERFGELAEYRADGGLTPGLEESEEDEEEPGVPALATMSAADFAKELAELMSGESEDVRLDRLYGERR